MHHKQFLKWRPQINKGWFWYGRIGLALVMTYLVLNLAPLYSFAQDPFTWSPPSRIPDYHDESPAPKMVVDQNQTVHAFNYQPFLDAEEDDDTEAIFYRQWNPATGWTKPIDILLSPDGTKPQIQGVFLDKNEIVHLIFFGGTERQGAIFYTYAHLSNASYAPGWSAPEIIGEDAGPFPFADLEGDDNGNLLIVYQGKSEGIGLYEIHSTNYGDTWSAPSTLFLIYEPLHWPTAIRLEDDQQGRFHATWSVWNDSGTSEEVYYSRLESDLIQWSPPIVLAQKDEGDYEADWANLITLQDELLMIYQDSTPATKWMRRSFDGGLTWTEPQRPWSHVGEYSRAQLVVDNNHVLHVLLGNRSGDCCHGMWHGVWFGERWSDLEPLIMGPKTPQFDPSGPEAVMVQGNTILVTWITDTGGLPRNGAWYSFKQLPDTTMLPIKPISTVTPVPTAMAIEKQRQVLVTPTTVPTAIPPNTSEVATTTSQTQPYNPAAPIIFGSIITALLIGGLLLIQYLFISRR